MPSMPPPLAVLLLLVAGDATTYRPSGIASSHSTAGQQPSLLPPVAADRSWRTALPGAAPPHLKYLGAWNANDYPDYPIHFLNLGLQDAFQFLGPTGMDPAGPVLDEDALRQAVASAAAGQAVLVRVEHVFFGPNMPYNHLCGDAKPAWCNYLACMCAVGNSTSGPLSHWRNRWAVLRAALTPFIENGTVKGVQMGDELLGQCLSLQNLTSAVELVRESWPDAIIYVNEAIGPTVWDRNYCNRTVRNGWNGPAGADDPPELGSWRFPTTVDLVGVDMQGCTYQPGICARYNVSRAVAADPTACPNESIWFNDCMSEKGEDANDCGVPQRCAQLLRTWHTEHIYKRFVEGSHTRALFTPSAWGTNVLEPTDQPCTGVIEAEGWGGPVPCSAPPPTPGPTRPSCINPPNWTVAHELETGCPMPSCSGRYGWDRLWADFALEMWAWVKNDTMLAGFAVFHWHTYEVRCGCGGCYNPPTELGLTSLPKTLGVWLEIGLKMLGRGG